MSCSPRCCASSTPAGTYFSKHARRYFKSYKKEGLAKEQRLLVEGIKALPLEGKSILEIGCGVGSVHLTLLQDGASSSMGIDAAEGMIEKAKILSRELSLENRAEYIHGDFVSVHPSVRDADITIMDKVICCYENVDDLVANSLKKTRLVYAVSFPRPTMFVKFTLHIPIIAAKILRWSFRPYWHDWLQIVRKIETEGFQRVYVGSTVFWSIYVFRRM